MPVRAPRTIAPASAHHAPVECTTVEPAPGTIRVHLLVLVPVEIGMVIDLQVWLRHLARVLEKHGLFRAAHKDQMILGYPDDFRHEQTSDIV